MKLLHSGPLEPDPSFLICISKNNYYICLMKNTIVLLALSVFAFSSTSMATEVTKTKIDYGLTADNPTKIDLSVNTPVVIFAVSETSAGTSLVASAPEVSATTSPDFLAKNANTAFSTGTPALLLERPGWRVSGNAKALNYNTK